jgi:hypothetical protein
MLKIQRVCLIGSVLSAIAAPAWADVEEDVPPVTSAPDGQYSVVRGVQGPAGMVSARILLDFNLSTDNGGKPISLAPDIYYSVTDRLQIGLLHQGPMGWQARPGVGICLTGEDNGCPEVYDNVGFDLMYGLAFEKLHMSAHGSLFINSFDPTLASLAFGFAGKAHFSPRIALYFDPKIAIAVTERDIQEDAVHVPLELQFQVGAPNTLKLLTGVTGPLDGFGDFYQIPVGIGFMRNLSEHFDLGARFSFDNLLGNQPENVDAADTRSLAVLLNVRS